MLSTTLRKSELTLPISAAPGLIKGIVFLHSPGTNINVTGVGGYQSFWPGLEEGDEVLATPMTCTASNWPILANGLKIKWVDIDPKTLNMDLDDLERKITPKTKVIMLVHWGDTQMI